MGGEMTAATFKVLSALLSYPTEALTAEAPTLRRIVIDEGLVPAPVRDGLMGLIDQLAERDLYDLRERYVLLFDRTRSVSLHLFEHVHGEGRDRGQAMIDLLGVYERGGLYLEAKELPDHLPVFLEFLSTRPIGEAKALLAETVHILAALETRLRKRDSAYATVFAALQAIVGAPARPEDLDPLLAAEDDRHDDLEAMDAAWEAEAVTFGPQAAPGDCPNAAAMLRRINAPGEPVPSASGRRAD